MAVDGTITGPWFSAGAQIGGWLNVTVPVGSRQEISQ